jgi:hypothetical protein
MLTPWLSWRCIRVSASPPTRLSSAQLSSAAVVKKDVAFAAAAVASRLAAEEEQGKADAALRRYNARSSQVSLCSSHRQASASAVIVY